jgi:hypothetical protein
MTSHKVVFWRHKAPIREIDWHRRTLGLHHHFSLLRAIRLISPTRPPVLHTSGRLAETTVDPLAPDESGIQRDRKRLAEARGRMDMSPTTMMGISSTTMVIMVVTMMVVSRGAADTGRRPFET